MAWSDVNKNRWDRIRDAMDRTERSRQRGMGYLSEGMDALTGQLDKHKGREHETEMQDTRLQHEEDMLPKRTTAELNLQRGLYGETGIMSEANRREREAKQDWDEKVYLPFQERIAAAGRSTQNVFAGESDMKWGVMLDQAYESWKKESLAMNPGWVIMDENGQPIGYRIPEEAWEQFRQRARSLKIPDELIDSFIESMRYAVEGEPEDIPKTPGAGIFRTSPEDMDTAMRIGYKALESTNVPMQLWQAIEKLTRLLFDPQFREEEKQKLRELIERLQEKAERIKSPRSEASPSGQLRQTSEGLQRLREGMHPDR